MDSIYSNLTQRHVNVKRPLRPPSADAQQSDRSFCYCEGAGPKSSTPGMKGCAGVITGEIPGLWINGQAVVYAYCENDNVIQRNKVDTVIQEWARWTNLQFQYQPDINEETHIRISFREQRNWSAVGRQPKVKSTEETMMLGSVSSATIEATELEKGMILHEWGHVLGLYHEHQSPGLSLEGFAWNENAILAYFMSYFKVSNPSAELKAWLQDNIYSTYETSNYIDFDPWSIMTYCIPPQCYSFEVIKPNSVVWMDVNYELSMQDMAFMVIHYPRPGDALTLRNALLDLRIPLRATQGWDHSNVRQKFWAYQSQLKYPSLNVILSEQPNSSLQPGKPVYDVVTRTNLWEFKAVSRITREHSEFETLFALLKEMARDWAPLKPRNDDRPANPSKTYTLTLFMKEICSNISNQHEDFREILRRFLQGDSV